MEGTPPLTPVLVGLTVADDTASWQAGGFTVGEDATCRIGAVTVTLAGRENGRGIRSWTLTGLAVGATEIDGVTTIAADALVLATPNAAEDTVLRDLDDPDMLSAGDVVAPRLAVHAILEGRVAGMSI